MAVRGSNLPKVAPIVAAVTLLGAVGTVGAVGVLNRDDGTGAAASTTLVAASVTAALPTDGRADGRADDRPQDDDRPAPQQGHGR